MICDFIARTNWSNIESNYFVDTIIIFDLSYYTNITQLMWLSGRLMLLVAEVRGSIPCETPRLE